MNAMMWSKYSSASATVMLILLLLASNGSTNPDAKVDVKVNVDGKEVIHASHPKKPETSMEDAKPTVIAVPRGFMAPDRANSTDVETRSVNRCWQCDTDRCCTCPCDSGKFYRCSIPPQCL